MDIKEKIYLIKEITSKLANEEFPFITITLEHYKLPQPDTWEGIHDYIISSLRKASSQVLLSISKSFNINVNDFNDSNPTFWRADHFKLFLTHVSKIKDKVSKVRDELFNYGISSFVAHDDIEPTKEWQEEIELGLNTMDALIAFITPDFHESNWTDQEIGYALGRNKLVVPIKISNDPYGFISKNQALQGNGKDAKTISRDIFNILSNHEKTKEGISYCLVRKFENSFSFAESKANFELIKKCSYMNDELIKRIEIASENNYQICTVMVFT